MQIFIKKHLFHRLVSIFIILSLIGVSPGLFDTNNLTARSFAAPFTEQKIDISSDHPMSVDTSAASETPEIVENIDSDLADDSIKKREMSRAEELAWSIGKALIPTLAVMAFSAAVVCPLAWVVVGSVLVGATAAGALTLSYELRKNSFRSEDQKRTMDKILREVSIQAAVSGAMAPFNMLTAGMVQAVGPITAKTIIQTAAKAGAVSFLGSTVSNVTKGAVTNLWYNNYYNYDQREKELKKIIAEIEKLPSRTSDQEKHLVAAIEELDTITKEKYTWENFRKDEKKALVSAGISGILGGTAARFAGNSDWAKIASSKLFGDTGKSRMVANAVVSNPFAFATGAANAALERKEILNQIEINRIRQVKYEKDSPAWNYYEHKIADLEEAFKSISLSEAGKQAMINNAANQTAMVGVSLAKTRLWDLPSQRRAKIRAAYEAENPDWKKASEARQELELLKAKRPQPDDFASKSEYTQALRDYVKAQNEIRDAYTRAKIDATTNEKSPENLQRLREATERVDAEIEFSREAELARALGRDSYVEFKMKELQKDPENQSISTSELRQKAEASVAEGYDAAAQDHAMKLAQMEAKLERQKMILHGKVEKGVDGKNYVVVTDDNGEAIHRRLYEGGDGAFWIDRSKNLSAAELKQAEISRIVKEVYDASAMVKPTTFRNEFVNMRVNQMRAKGMTEEQIDSQLGNLVTEANGKTYDAFGQNWASIAKAEILASGLERARYDDGAAPNASKILDFLKNELTSRSLSTVQTTISGGITGIMPNAVIKTDPLAPILRSDERDNEILNRLSEKAMRDYHQRYNEFYR